jgi:hypothetical protein
MTEPPPKQPLPKPSAPADPAKPPAPEKREDEKRIERFPER